MSSLETEISELKEILSILKKSKINYEHEIENLREKLSKEEIVKENLIRKIEDLFKENLELKQKYGDKKERKDQFC